MATEIYPINRLLPKGRSLASGAGIRAGRRPGAECGRLLPGEVVHAEGSVDPGFPGNHGPLNALEQGVTGGSAPKP